MIAVDIPGFRDLRLDHLVVDYNGTLAKDGVLLPGVAEAIHALAGTIQIHVVTADTFGLAAEQLAGLPVERVIIAGAAQADRKLEFVESLDADHVFAIGNGRNDRKMLAAAAVGIALIQREGGAVESFISADVIALDILDAFGLLQHPKRLIATLRS
jgi:soluble P-type ATPase